MFDYDFWTRNINRRIHEAAGDQGAVVVVKLNDGREFYVRNVVETRTGTVALDVYDYNPTAAKPMVQSTSEVYLLDVPVVRSSRTRVIAFESISDVEIRRISPETSRLRLER